MRRSAVARSLLSHRLVRRLGSAASLFFLVMSAMVVAAPPAALAASGPVPVTNPNDQRCLHVEPENAFFLNAPTPVPGATVGPGSTVGAWFSDETGLNVGSLNPASAFKIVFTLTKTGTGGFTDTITPDTTEQSVRLSFFDNTHRECKYEINVKGVIPMTHNGAPLPSGDYTASLTAWDNDQNSKGGDKGNQTWSFHITAIGNFAGHIYDCSTGTPANPPAEILGGTIGATGPQAINTDPNPLLPRTVLAGGYAANATNPASYHFVDCGSGAGITNSGHSASEAVNVPENGTGTAVFFVERDKGNLTGHILDCADPAHPEVLGGTIAVAGPPDFIAANNPITYPVPTGTYAENATAPANYHFVQCGGNAVISGGGAAATVAQIIVPRDGSGNANFYVVHDAGAITGHIFDCTSGSQTVTEVTGGRIAVSGPMNHLAADNPITYTKQLTGTYAETATAPAHFHFVTCGGNAVVGNPATAATVGSVIVPANGTGNAVFYVAPNPGAINVVVVICNADGTVGSAAPTGTTITIPSTVDSAGVKAPTNVVAQPGSYGVTATTAPTGYHLVKCGAGGGDVNGGTAGQTAVVVSDQTTNVVFYVQANPTPPVTSVLGAATTQPNTGRSGVVEALLTAFFMMVIGAALIRAQIHFQRRKLES